MAYLSSSDRGVKGWVYFEQDAKTSPGPWRATCMDRLPDRPALRASITCESKTVVAGGIGRMRQGMSSSKDLRRQHERPGTAYGLIRGRCRPGSNGKENNDST